MGYLTGYSQELSVIFRDHINEKETANKIKPPCSGKMLSLITSLGG